MCLAFTESLKFTTVSSAGSSMQVHQLFQMGAIIIYCDLDSFDNILNVILNTFKGIYGYNLGSLHFKAHGKPSKLAYKENPRKR